MIYSHGVVIRRVWVDVRVSERPSLVFSWELKVRNDTEPTDSSPSPGSAAATMRRIDLDLEAPDDDVISVRRSAVDDGDRAAQCRNLGESRDVAPGAKRGAMPSNMGRWLSGRAAM